MIAERTCNLVVNAVPWLKISIYFRQWPFAFDEEAVNIIRNWLVCDIFKLPKNALMDGFLSTYNDIFITQDEGGIQIKLSFLYVYIYRTLLNCKEKSKKNIFLWQ